MLVRKHRGNQTETGVGIDELKASLDLKDLIFAGKINGRERMGGESGGGVYLSLGLYLLVTECVLHCLLVISKHCSLCAFLKQALGFKKQEPVPSLSLFVTAQYQELSPHRYYPAGAVTFFRSDVK